MKQGSPVKGCGGTEALYKYDRGTGGVISRQSVRSNHSRGVLRAW